MGNFDPKQHIIKLKNKDYLETKWRIAWFRDDHPNGAITAEIVNFDPLIIKATIYSGEGAVLATGHGTANDKGNAVWSGRGIEKAETAAVGRALGHAGYGTQFAGDGNDDDEAESGHLADSPNERKQPQQNGKRDKATERAQLTANNGQQHRTEDLRDKDVAVRFIQRWRGQSLSDSDVLLALGVSRLSEWTKGRGAADDTINEWLAGKLTQADKDFAAL